MGKKSRRGSKEDAGKSGGTYYYVYEEGDEGQDESGWLEELINRWASRALIVTLTVAALVTHSLAALFPTRAEAERRSGAASGGTEPGSSSGASQPPPPPPAVDNYALLGLEKSAKPTEAEVRTAFRKLSLQCHPDKCVSCH